MLLPAKISWKGKKEFDMNRNGVVIFSFRRKNLRKTKILEERYLQEEHMNFMLVTGLYELHHTLLSKS